MVLAASHLTVHLHSFILLDRAQVFLLLLIMVQVFLALQPAWYYWKFIEDLASTSFGGYSKQPWLYVDLPVLGEMRARLARARSPPLGVVGTDEARRDDRTSSSNDLFDAAVGGF